MAFEAEDFSKARALFERALAAGMQGPAIHYDIGAAAYLRRRSATRRKRVPRSRAHTFDGSPGLLQPRTRGAGYVTMSAKRANGSSAPSRNIHMSVWRNWRRSASRSCLKRARRGVVLLLARRRRLRRQRLAALSPSRARPLDRTTHTPSSFSPAATRSERGASIRARRCSSTRASMNTVSRCFPWARRVASASATGTSSSAHTVRSCRWAAKSTKAMWRPSAGGADILRRKPAARAGSRYLGQGRGCLLGADRRTHGIRLVLRKDLAGVELRRALTRGAQ